jgi:hypothetical protein
VPTTVVPLCDGGAVVVDDESLAGVLLNPVGAFVYARLAAGETSLPALVAAVAAEFDAPPDVIEADVTRFLDEIYSRGSGLPSTLYGAPTGRRV